MTKHFCDECGVELTAEELRFSLEMIGSALCSKHAHERIDGQTKIYKYVKSHNLPNPLNFPEAE